MIKNTYLFFVFLYMSALTSFSQEVPEGGADVIATDLTTVGFYGGSNGSKNIVPVEDESFGEALELKVTKQPENTYNMGATFPALTGVKQGDALLFTLVARTLFSIQETGEGFVAVVVEDNKTYDKVMDQKISIGNSWQRYFVRVKCPRTLSKGQLNIAFQCGFPRQTIEVGAIRLINYEDSLDADSLPETEITYQGRALDASWRAEANARIERYRKGKLKINVVDKNNKRVPDVEVRVSMKNHAFGFGTAVDANTFFENKRYQDVVTSLFNEVVLENDLKWSVWQWEKNYELTMRAVEKLQQLKIPLRGHVLVWPSYHYNPDFVKEYKDDADDLRKLVNEHIKDIVTNCEGKVIDWDVLNEPYNNTEFMDVLGFEEMAEWFKLAKKYDSNAKLFINDYSILSGGGLDVAHQDDYYKKIKFIDNLGGKIEGIGFQSHFASQLTDPNKLYEILERFAVLKKDIKITEFDVNLNQLKVQADYTRDFMTMIFSHPSVKSLMFWGFWENRHWRPDAALFTKDWKSKPNFEVFRKLVFEDWWTQPLVYKSEDAEKVFEGFLGTYEMSALYQGKAYKQVIEMKNPNSPKTVVFKLTAESQSNETIVIYPNVSKDAMLVSGLTKDVIRKVKKITLTDVAGNQVFLKVIGTVQKDSVVLNFKGSDGLYIIRFFDENGDVFYRSKVIKKSKK